MDNANCLVPDNNLYCDDDGECADLIADTEECSCNGVDEGESDFQPGQYFCGLCPGAPSGCPDFYTCEPDFGCLSDVASTLCNACDDCVGDVEFCEVSENCVCNVQPPDFDTRICSCQPPSFPFVFSEP